jgi:predicted permease
MMLDVRLALRALRKSPGFSAAAILTLALGIGANTAIFSAIESVLLSQLPYRDPDRIVALAQVDSPEPRVKGAGAWTAAEWRTRSRSLESVSVYDDAQRTLVENGEAEVLRGMRVSFEFFDTLGVRVQLGRTFLPDEDRSRANVIVFSHDLWVRRFGADPKIVGQTVQLNEEAFRVIGVLPSSFGQLRMTNRAEIPQIFMPLGHESPSAPSCRSCMSLNAIGRLKREVNVSAARSEINGVMRDIMRDYPGEYPRNTSVRVESLQDQLVGPARLILWLLMGAVAVVLLIACANVASLQVARASVRRREFALRAALGASRGRLIGQLLIENLVLAGFGAAAGLLCGWWGSAGIAYYAPMELPRFDEVHLDPRVLLFALTTTILSGLIVGMAPAWSALRVDLNETLKRSGTRPGRLPRLGLREAAVIAEIALAFVLVVATGLLEKSLTRLMAVEPGFDSHRVLTLTPVSSGTGRYRSSDGLLRYYREMVDKVRLVPGVVDAGMVSNVPLSRTEPRKSYIEGRTEAGDADTPDADVFLASPDYFRTLKIPLRRGRFLTDRDGLDHPPAALVSESFARLRFGGTDPIGKRIKIGPTQSGPWLNVVGIVGDVKNLGLDREPDQAIYQPQAMNPFHYTRLVVRTSGNPWDYERAVRAAIRDIDPTQPVFHVQPLDDYLASSVAERTFAFRLIGLFGLLALVLAVVGVYGVLACSVAQRTQEIGIRAALGASARNLLTTVMRDGLLLAGTGVTLGVLLALGATRVLTSLLYGVDSFDVATVGLSIALVMCVAALACYLPARRAARLDPYAVLRAE